jgi:hypothetical protein
VLGPFLFAGDSYAISFCQAASEQNAGKNGVAYSSPTTEQWSVVFSGTLVRARRNPPR